MAGQEGMKVGRAQLPRSEAWLRCAAVLAIMAVALVLRLIQPGLAEFKIDEVQPLALAEQILLDHQLPATRGLTSFGLPGTPFVGYLLALPRTISSDPRGAIVTMGLLGALAVLITYLGMRRYAGERAALLAAALYAVNPWAVFLTRKTWSEILPLLTVLALWAACAVVIERKPVWALAFFPLLALQVQTHVLGVLYLPALLLTVALFWPRWRSRHTLYGAMLGLLVLLPYLVILVGQWPATAATLQQKAGQGLALDARALSFALWFASGRTLTALLGGSVAVLRSWEEALGAVNWLAAGALAAGLAAAAWALVRRKGAEYHALLLIWLAAPVVPMLVMPGETGIHYLEIVLPMLFLLGAAGWALLFDLRRRIVVAAGIILLGAVLAVQAGAVLAVYDGIARYPTDGGFGRPLGAWLDVQHGVQARIAAEGWRDMAVVGTDDAPWSSERAIVDYLLGRSVRLHYVGQGGRPGVLVPERGELPTLVLAADGTMAQALARYGEEVEHWPMQGSAWSVRLYRLHGRPQAEIARDITLPAAATLENGMRLLGARVDGAARPGGKLLTTSYWTFTGDVRGANAADTGFNHLLEAGGQRWAQYDGFAWGRSGWLPGYTLVQWFELDLPGDMPAGDYWLYSGMYAWCDMAGARVLDDAGQPAADGVRLGPIRVTP